MNKLIKSIKFSHLISIAIFVALISWCSLCRWHYESYWNGTIFRVQTVDFNLLHHCLPTTLSQLILSGKDEELQSVLNSTYGIFGLVITDAQGKEVLFKTNKIYQRASWQPLLSIDYLNEQKEPFDLLTDPIPVVTQHIHQTPRETAAKYLAKPPGKIIGRLYYLRGIPPRFLEDMSGFVFSNWLDLGGSRRGYLLITLAVIGFASTFVIFILWWQKLLKSKESILNLKEQELSTKKQALEHLNSDIAAQRKRKEWLEQEAELSYQRALRIKESLDKLRQEIFYAEPINNKQTQNFDPNPNVRPPLYRASSLIGEVESLLPELCQNAKVLKSQAEVWQSYCTQLEAKHDELERLLKQKTTAAPFGRSAGIAESYIPPDSNHDLSNISQHSLNNEINKSSPGMFS